MNKHINFEDNIFVLNLQIRRIQDLLILDIDTELFMHKTLDDLDFTNSVLNILLANLRENFQLIERGKQFYNLMETERLFCKVLNAIDHSEGNISAIQQPALRERIGFLADHSQDRQNSLKELITESRHHTHEPVVSYDELNTLFKNN